MERSQRRTLSIAVPERGNWSNPIEFILCCLGYAVGVGNVWRFPYLCYRNGGGAFLLMYIIMAIIMGAPIFLLEVALGQYTGFGPNVLFSKIAPIFCGLGYCTLIVITLITIYYMVILAWVTFYLFATFNKDLGWGQCNNRFNSQGCFSAVVDESCGPRETYYNHKCTDVRIICKQFGLSDMINRTYCSDKDKIPVHLDRILNRTLATQEYFNEFVLGVGDATWENFGSFRWQLFLCLLLVWIVAFICVLHGIKSSGKAVYFTALFPYVVLTALVIRSATLEGSLNGIIVYIKPKWELLRNVDVWGHAASQTFYSFGISCGSLITLASYNDFKNNCLRDVYIISLANMFTSVYAGFAIFGMLGFLAKQLDVPIEKVATTGPGLAFVAYLEALLRIPFPHLWSMLFFIMLLSLGLGSQFAGIEVISTTILDKWPKCRKKESLVYLFVCVSCCLLAIPMCFQGGIYLFTLLEWNTASWAILLIGLCEVGAVSWIYGCKRFLNNIRTMDIYLPQIIYAFWWICWVILTPLTLVGVFIFQMIEFSPAKYENYIFPKWADAIGICIGLSTIAPMPITLVYYCLTSRYHGMEWFQPTSRWSSQLDRGRSS